MSSKDNTSHKQILKSSGIIGGSQIITIIISIIRTKIIAILLGPIGIGLMGLFQATVDLIKNATGFGLGFSAVREVAGAAATNDQNTISRTIITLRRWVWATGIFGSLLTLLFSRIISKHFLKDESYTWPIIFLSVTVLLSALSSGQLALLQGLRQIKKMATANVFGALFGLICSIPIYWFLGVRGIIPGMIVSAIILLLVTWYQSKSIKLNVIQYSFNESFKSGLGMIKLGLFTVLTGFASTGTLYVVRLFIARKAGITQVGEFQASWNFSMLYLTAVLTAMAADYYPRLTQVKDDNYAIKKLVNEQTEIALLIAGPIIIGMLSFSPIIVHLLYSSKFEHSALILQWQIAGDFLKILAWPLGFVILAKGNGKYFIFSEFMWNAVYLAFIWFGWNKLNISITGVAFCIAYLMSLSINYFFAKSKCGFSWSIVNKINIFIFFILTLVALINSLFTKNNALKFSIGAMISLGAIIYAFYNLLKILPLQSIKDKINNKFQSNKG